MPVSAFIGQVTRFAGRWIPKDWEPCDGRLLQVADYKPLFSILRYTYGGDGHTTFALPDLRGRVAIGTGQGPGLTNYELGQQAGQTTISLKETNLPAHSHVMMASPEEGVQNTSAYAALASNTRLTNPPMPDIYTKNSKNLVSMGTATAIAGEGEPVSLMQPYLAINYIICVVGIYPSHP